MRVTIVAVGTRGDVQPMLALAGGLRAAGHRVRFATEAGYAQAVTDAGLEYHHLSGESESFNAGRYGAVFRVTLERPATRYVRFWKAYVTPTARQHLRESVPPCEGADLLLCQPWLGSGPSLAEKFGVPAVVTSVVPAPEVPTRAFPFPLSSQARADLPPHENWRSWRRAIPIVRVGHETLQAWRMEVLGLPAQSFRTSLAAMQHAPHLLGCSPLLVPRPAEWGDTVQVTGFWFLDAAASFQPPRALERFLAAGEPPVVVGFGSHIGLRSVGPARLTRLVLEALASARRRAILITGWGALEDAGLPDTVLCAQSIPYDWLLPKALAIVHHGGAGTVAIAMRTGLPQVIVPLGWDQTFWAHRAAALGLSPEPMPARMLTSEALATAIAEVTVSESMHRRAGEVAQVVRRERGIENAVRWLEQLAAGRPPLMPQK